MQQTVLSLLTSIGDEWISGEEIAKRLSISRAAVWKQIERLRADGYDIEAATRVGYRLRTMPDRLEAERVLAYLDGHSALDTVHVLKSIDSTNSEARRKAEAGAPAGSVWVADEQTGGRGRKGREFLSPPNMGVYLSILLRPNLAADNLPPVTAMAAVAACNAVETAAGIRPEIKWMNDLMLPCGKIAGILTELSTEWESGAVDSLIIGIGFNCNQRHEDFPEELRGKAGSIFMETGNAPDRSLLAASLIVNLRKLGEDLTGNWRPWMERYRAACTTIGKPIRILQGPSERNAFALGVEDSGALRVRYPDGSEGIVTAGDVSVRGTESYV